MVKTCPTCGRSFKVHPCTLRRGAGKYCSRPCRPYQGSGNPKWRGGRIVESGGRVRVYAPGHPNAVFGGKYIYEYRLIASEILGRPLRDDEIVHHINGDVTDNRSSNLVVTTQSKHVELHRKELVQARREQARLVRGRS